MKEKFKKISWGYVSIVMLSLLCSFIGVADASAMGVTVAEAPIIGRDGVGKHLSEVMTEELTKENSELIRAVIMKEITEYLPESTPLTSITSHFGSTHINSNEIEYYSSDIKPIMSITTAATTEATDSNCVVTVKVSNPRLFQQNETIRVAGVEGYTDKGQPAGHSLVCIVTDIIDGAIKIQAINGKSSSRDRVTLCPVIPVGTKFYRMGKAHNELDVQTTPYSILPTKESNYLQIFKMQIETGSLWATNEGKEVAWTPNAIERAGMYDMKRTMEGSYWFGEKSRTLAQIKDEKGLVSDKEVYTTRGIIHSINKKIEYGNSASDLAIDNKQLMNILKGVFIGNSGSKRRILVGGSGFTEKFSFIDKVQRQSDNKPQVQVWGIDWNELTSPFGSLMHIQNALFDEYGYEDVGVVLDPNFIDKYTRQDMERLVLDLKSSGQRNTDANVFTDISGLTVRYPQVHAVIAPKGMSTI